MVLWKHNSDLLFLFRVILKVFQISSGWRKSRQNLSENTFKFAHAERCQLFKGRYFFWSKYRRYVVELKGLMIFCS